MKHVRVYNRSRRPVLTSGKLRKLRLPAQIQIKAITYYKYYFGVLHHIKIELDIHTPFRYEVCYYT